MFSVPSNLHNVYTSRFARQLYRFRRGQSGALELVTINGNSQLKHRGQVPQCHEPHRNATKAMMNGVAHCAAGHIRIGDAVRKIMRKRDVCLV